MTLLRVPILFTANTKRVSDAIDVIEPGGDERDLENRSVVETGSRNTYMPSKNADNQIQARIETFVDEISELIQRAALSSVHAALAGKLGFTPPTTLSSDRPRRDRNVVKGAKVARKAGRGGRRVRRSSENVQELAAQVRAAVRSGPGRRLGEIAAELDMDANDIRRPAQVLVAERKLRTTGQRGGTRYFPGGSGGAPSKTKKASKKKTAKRGRKARKGASRKAAKRVATPAA